VSPSRTVETVNNRIVFVTGGVCSSLGKGILAASLGRLLIDRGLTVRNIKLDPYLNIDPGTMRPSEHGEVFVTASGAETDLDLGHYERFTDVDTTAACSISAGKVYWDVLNAERRGELLGSTVQAVPHITDGIINAIDQAAAEPVNGAVPDVVIAEIGGTVGDIEIGVFLEAVRQLRADRPGRVLTIHLTLVPEVGPNREAKTKPSQHSIAALRQHGISPEILVARSAQPLSNTLLEKLRVTCGVSAVIGAPDVTSIYQVPENLAASGLDVSVISLLGLPLVGNPDLTWRRSATAMTEPPPGRRAVRVAIVGKYNAGHDTYLSISEAVGHAAAAQHLEVDISIVDAEQLTVDPDTLDGYDAVIVAGGFGHRGVEGKITASRWCRTRDIAYLGLCLGLQVAVIDHARAAGITDAGSAEWGNPDDTDVIVLIDDQQQITDIGGTMRLGDQRAELTPGSVVARFYGTTYATERHRHRYEVDPGVTAALESAGLIISGRSAAGLVEYVERADQRYYIATQAHPEFASRPERPHPLFTGLLRSAART
jgi:CTP synthase